MIKGEETNMKSYRNVKFAYFALPILVFFVFCCSHSTVSVDYYPTEDWRMSTPEEQGMHSDNLLKMMESIQEGQVGIDSVSINRNGYLVLDSYIYPYEDGQKHKMYSVTKSITSALIGIAIDKGFIKSVDQNIVDFFPNREILNLDDHKKSMTLKHLLMMTSGLQANDGWEKNWAGLFEMMKSNDWTQYALNLPMETAPGERFEYYNCNSHLLSAIINETTGMKTVDFATKFLFGPLGITNVKWDASPEGVNIGYAGLWLDPKEMTKIGLLYLNKGIWEGKQIISSNWISESTKPYQDPRLLDMKYGYQWWVNPAGLFSANGMYGQFIYVVPEKNLVAVFTGNIKGMAQFTSISLLKNSIVPAIGSDEPLPPKPEAVASLNSIVEILASSQDSMASGQKTGMTWIGLAEGVAKDGIFKRTTTPSFSFHYPSGSIKDEMNSPLQIMKMQTPEGVSFNASLVKIPDGMTLEEFGPKYLTSLLQKFGSDVKVISNKEIVLKCGARAYRTDIKWLWNGTFPLNSLFVSAYKDGQCVFVAAHPMSTPEKVAPIVESLTLK